MRDSSSPFSSAVKDLTETARRQSGDAPSPEELFLYLDGELSWEDEERIRDQLALHPESARAVLDLVELSRMEGDDSSSSDMVAPHVPSWSSMQAHFADQTSMEPPAPRRRSRLSWRHPGLWLAAAVTLVLGMGLLARIFTNPPVPQKNILWTHLQPDGAARSRDAGTWQTIRLPDESPQVMLILNLGDAGDFQDYGVEILGTASDSEVRWNEQGFRPGPLGTFDLLLPRNFLAAGRYRIRLEGLTDDGAETLAWYRIELVDGQE